MNKKLKLFFLIFVLMILGYLFSMIGNIGNQEVEATEEEISILKEEPSSNSKQTTSQKVDIKGAVVHPGVYSIPDDSRIIDVITIAGGLREDASTEFLNLSKKVKDEDVIWIYTQQEIETLKEGKTTIEYVELECQCPEVSNAACLDDLETGEESVSSDKKVNINQATKEELMNIPGIGEAKAEAILEYRQKKQFETLEEIKEVSGIGDSLYEKIVEYITI